MASSTDVNGAPITVPTYYANSPAGTWTDWAGNVHDSGTPLRKFVDQLSPLGCAAPTPTLGQCIPIATPSKWVDPDGVTTNADYYEIGIVEYREKMHSDLPKATTLRGYVQLVPPTFPGAVPLTTANGLTQDITDAAGNQLYGAAKPHYLGPLIAATSGTPVRIKYSNLLPSGHFDPVTGSRGGDLFLPVDTTLMGAGEGPLRDPDHQIGTKTLTLSDGVTQVTQPVYEEYTQNRAEIHLHGGDNPWISDGTPYQWITPAGEATSYKTGASFQNVPDMPSPGDGAGTLFWTNNQSGRLMFYHDHAAGITRLNVYAGLAAGYLVSDQVEATLPIPGTVPTDQIPLVIQDKTFVPVDIAQQDAKWDTVRWGEPGDLWFPHVYETNQDPNSFDGTNPPGRWDWGPWFWPVFPATYALPAGNYGDVSATPEAFMDTPVVNGTAYPTLAVEPKAYRFRVLDATNDRFLNLGLYLAEPMTIALVSAGTGYTAPVVAISPPDLAGGVQATATATWGLSTITVTNGGANYTAPTVTLSAPDIIGGIPATATATLAVSAIAVTNGGTGYTAPVVTIDPPAAGGVQATATATVDATGAISVITVTNPGTGYATAPNVTIADSTGTGAAVAVNAVVAAIVVTNPGTGYTSPPTVTVTDSTGSGATAASASGITGIKLANPGSGYTKAPTVAITDPTGAGAFAVASVNSEVKMIPAVATMPSCSTLNPTINPATGLPLGAGVTCWPDGWPSDSRAGGVPDPATAGPKIIQIGSEGGLLPAPTVIPSQPTNFEYNRRSATVLNVSGPNGLYLGPAERADVVIDFSQYAGKTLILYNDAPAPTPGFDPRIDYYTGNPDQTAVGGAPSTLPGFGPNTRTVMQIVVAPSVTTPPSYPVTTTGAIDETALGTALPAAYAASQPKPIVPEADYNSAFGQAWTNTYARIYTGATYLGKYQPITFVTPEAITYKAATAATTSEPATLTTSPAGTKVSAYVHNKAIQELFEPNYGRMNATLGIELPFTSAFNQTTIPLGYIDPTTETIANGETQFWKVTHNGVDTHPVHFHLVNVQLINRVGWDGTIKPPSPSEVGWKETIKMNPLEDVIVAVRAKEPAVPFGLPVSVRRLDPSQPLGSAMGFMQVDPVTGMPPASPIVNTIADFGSEYVWHCHILGHEENDFMRPVVLRTQWMVPAAPTNLAVNGRSLTWSDPTPATAPTTPGNLQNEIGFRIERAAGAGGFAPIGSALANAGSYVDTTTAQGTAYSYRVAAYNAAGTSAYSNVVMRTVDLSPLALVFPPQALNVGSQSQAATLANMGAAAIPITGITLGGTNPGQFSQTNDCGTSLAAGASCTINVTFTPTSPGNMTATLAVDNGAGMQTVSLSGTGVTVTLTPASLAFPPQLVGVSSPTEVATLTNTGTVALSITSIGLAGTNPGQFSQTNDCGTSLAAGASCTINVTFTPTAPGNMTATLAVNDATGTQTASLGGTGVAATATLTPASLAFPSQPVGASSPSQAATLTNTGTVALPITSIGLGGTNPSFFSQTNDCGSSLAAGASCTINVTFTPTATGTRNASVVVNDAAGTQTVSLSGTGTTVTLAPASLAFPAQPVGASSLSQAAVLTNMGATALSITSIGLGGTNPGQFSQTNNCGTSLAAGASCTIDVTFKPTTTGSKTATLSVRDAAGTQTVGLSGTGLAAAAMVTLAPTSLAFPSQVVGGSSPSQAATLTNTGTVALSITSIGLGGTNPGQFSQTSNCGTSLAAGASCTINVTFTPTAAGSKAATLSVRDAAGTQTVSLSGTAIAATATLTPASLAFPPQPLGVSSPSQAATLTNTGTAPLSIAGISLGGTTPSVFAQTNDCGTSLAAGASCTINVTFTPTAAGTSNATVVVNDAAGTQTVSLSGTGGAVTLSPASLAFPSQSLNVSSPSQSATLTNGGATALSITSIGLGGTNPGQFSQTNNCGASLAAGANCTINVTFTPTTTGSKTATLSVRDAAGTQTVSVSGTGVSAGTVALTPTSLFFPSEPAGVSSPPLAATLTNGGATALSITSVSIGGTNPGQFSQTNNCGTSLAAGASCTINVTFTPTAAGSWIATLIVRDPLGPKKVSLVGTGL